MNKNKSFYSLVITSFFMIFSLPLLAWDCCDDFNEDSCCECPCDSSWGITVEARVAYYHPSSKRVRRIYDEGWADYQLEISKKFRGFKFGSLCGGNRCGCSMLDNLEWSIWAGVSGFSRKGDSIGFHDDTKLQLVPVSCGLKIFYPIFCNIKIFIGGAVCYSFLRIRDHSEYVHEHVRKESWGGLFQSGMTYDFCNWAYASVFFDYFFQRFHFRDTSYSSFYGSNYYYDSRFIGRSDLNLDGYKIGVGLGVQF